jgi:zinc transporter, ZIP family
MKVPALALALAALVSGCGGGGDGELAVTQATLQPGAITLVARNGGDEAAHVAQLIVNDAFVDFDSSADTIPPGDVEAFVVPYHWIAGESYEIRLLLSTGDTVDYELEDAETA